MLVLSRRLNEKLVFPTVQATIQVLEIKRNAVRLGIAAPPAITVLREEIPDRVAEWTPPEPASKEQGATSAPEDDTANAAIRDACLLLGVARLQLNVGLTKAAETTLDQIGRQLVKLRSGNVNEPAGRRLPSPRRKALLVEDNANERELLALCLRQAGLDVDTAGDGVDALDYLRCRGTPDVVLLDMGLPRCDGPTAIREIRKDPRTAGVKVFAVTGHRQDEFDFSGGPAQLDGWFRKPIDPEALVARLNQELSGALYSSVPHG